MIRAMVLLAVGAAMAAGGCAYAADRPAFVVHAPAALTETAVAARAPAPSAQTSGKDGAAEDRPDQSLLDGRKVIYTGNFTVVVCDVVRAQDQAKALAESLGGYVQKMSAGTIVIRVPAAKFDRAAEGLRRIGTVAGREILAEDVTESYADLETRLRNARALKDKVLSLLARAATVKEALELEREAARITADIEKLQGQMNRLANLVAYGTLNVAFSSPVKYVAPELNVQLPFPWLRSLGLSTLFQFRDRGLY